MTGDDIRAHVQVVTRWVEPLIRKVCKYLGDSLATQWQEISLHIPQNRFNTPDQTSSDYVENHCVHCRQGMAAACLLEVFKNWNDSLVSWILPIISRVSDPRPENWETVAILQIWWWVIMRTADITTVYSLPLAFLSHPPPWSDID